MDGLRDKTTATSGEHYNPSFKARMTTKRQSRQPTPALCPEQRGGRPGPEEYIEQSVQGLGEKQSREEEKT